MTIIATHTHNHSAVYAMPRNNRLNAVSSNMVRFGTETTAPTNQNKTQTWGEFFLSVLQSCLKWVQDSISTFLGSFGENTQQAKPSSPEPAKSVSPDSSTPSSNPPEDASPSTTVPKQPETPTPQATPKIETMEFLGHKLHGVEVKDGTLHVDRIEGSIDSEFLDKLCKHMGLSETRMGNINCEGDFNMNM